MNPSAQTTHTARAAEPQYNNVVRDPVETEISADSRGAWNVKELWTYRELLYFLTWREIAVRYKQTIAGVAWAIIQPAMTMLVFSVFFGKLARVPSDGLPYPLFTLAGLVPWTFFANGLNQCSNSLVGNSSLITKVYFPRLVIPVAAVCTGLIDVLLSFVLLLAAMAWYGFVPGWNVMWLPAFFLLALTTALGAGIWLSVLNLRYRDVRFVVPFLTQLWLFMTPIAYGSSLVREPWRSVYGLNPMAGVVEGFRWCLLGTTHPPVAIAAASAFAACVVLITGALYFVRMESTFADRI
jgi:lipopolysaccharide transport system permease protein